MIVALCRWFDFVALLLRLTQGINTQKYGFIKNAALPVAQQRKNYTRQPLWLAGLALVILGSLGDFAALALAAQSVVAPLGSVTLVANLFFASMWLKEKLSRRDIVSTTLIILGSVVTVAFGDHTSVDYTMSDITRLFKSNLFAIYATFCIAMCVMLYVVVKFLGPKKLRIVELTRSYDSILDKDARRTAIKRDAALSQLKSSYAKWTRIHPLCLCALSGALGANSILFGKIVALLLKASFGGDNQFIYFQTYIYIATMLFCVFAQLHFLALALIFFDSLYCIPIFQCFWIVVSTIGGSVHFAERGV